jgi:phenylalanyl-tRNA synthetase beta chain
VAKGIIDEYPFPPDNVRVELPIAEVRRLLGMDFPVDTAADMLRRLQFEVAIEGDTLHVVVPNHRMDIGTGVVGRADLVEEIARIHGYDKIPNTIIADSMPPQWANVPLEREERTRDVLVALGLRENISYRFTTPEAEAMLTGSDGNRPIDNSCSKTCATTPASPTASRCSKLATSTSSATTTRCPTSRAAWGLC